VKLGWLRKTKYYEVIEMVYAMRVMVVAGILLVSVGCKKAVTPVQPQPATTATGAAPVAPVSAPAPTAPVPTKVAPPRPKARAPKGQVSGAIGRLLVHHGKLGGMPAC
jgi:hypothetical protein